MSDIRDQNSPKRSLVLSDWANAVDGLARSEADALNELVILSLVYDEILITDETLVLSSLFSRWVKNAEHARVWRELLETGVFTILTHPLRAYPDDRLKEMARRTPMAARAQYTAEFGSKYDKKFIMDAQYKAAHETLDAALKGGLSQRESGSLDPAANIMDQFRDRMVSILSNPDLETWRSSTFTQLKDPDFNRILEYALSPERIRDQLLDRHFKVPHVRGSDDIPVFNRSLLNQATMLFETSQQADIQNLSQSRCSRASSQDASVPGADVGRACTCCHNPCSIKSIHSSRFRKHHSSLRYQHLSFCLGLLRGSGSS